VLLRALIGRACSASRAASGTSAAFTPSAVRQKPAV
jgi:hypothetical protein